MKKFLIIISLIFLGFASSFFSSLFVTKGGGEVGDLPSAQAAAPKTGLVGWWTMDSNDLNGSTLYDKSGQGNHGTGTGITSADIVAGKAGQAIDFDGSTERVNFTAISLGTTQSCSAWVKLAVADTDAAIIGYDGSSYCLYFSSGSVYFNPGVSYVSWAYALNDNKWHHLSVTRNGTNATLYIDGVLQSTQSTGSGALSLDEIGTTNNSFNFTGSIDDVRIYNRTLSATEVANLYSAKTTYTASAPKQATSTSAGRLVGWWTMDTNNINGTNYYDKSGFNNTATSTGGPTIATGKINQAVSLNGGSSQFLDIAHQARLNSYPITVSAWFKTTTASGAVVNKYLPGSANGWQLFFYSGTLCGWYWKNGSTYIDNGNCTGLSISATPYLNNQWHLATLVVDSSGGNLYVDGVSKKTNGWIGTPGAMTATNDVKIGSYPNDTYFTGSIDDVRIYDYALSAQEVANLYNSAKINYVSALPRNNLILDLNFGNNNGAATPKVYDTSGNSRHATAINAQTCNSSFCDFDGSGDYLTASGSSLNNSILSIAVKFSPDFNIGSTINRFIDSSNGSRVELYTCTNGGCGAGNNLIFGINAGLTLSVSTATVSPYWKVGQINTLIVVATSGNNKMYLNGNLLGSNSTAWSAQNPATLYIGANFAGGQLFDGKMYYMKFWNRLLTAAEVATISADRNMYVR